MREEITNQSGQPEGAANMQRRVLQLLTGLNDKVPTVHCV